MITFTPDFYIPAPTYTWALREPPHALILRVKRWSLTCPSLPGYETKCYICKSFGEMKLLTGKLGPRFTCICSLWPWWEVGLQPRMQCPGAPLMSPSSWWGPGWPLGLAQAHLNPISVFHGPTVSLIDCPLSCQIPNYSIILLIKVPEYTK